MLKIRLQRLGRNKLPYFRLVVAEHTKPVQGKFIEKLGAFMAHRKEETLQLDKERIIHWISVGAQPSQTVARLLVSQGVEEARKYIDTKKHA